ncbi:porin [Minwuia thermotolerans]|uniref:porin n=1 Tax=Minwuia thermotolerans TaxID=2056226 RepID=UPI0013DDDE3C|nr:porin [Minwuia thermotolerans]
MNHKYLLAGVAAAALLTAGNAYAAAHGSVEDQLKAQSAAIDALSKEVEALKNSTVEQGIGQGVKGVELTISGHINRAMMFISDGNDNSTLTHVDNDAASSRIRFDADAPVSASTTVGARLEMEMESNSSAQAVLDNEVIEDTFATRQAYVFVKGGFGTLVMGHQSEATDGIVHNSFNFAANAGINPEYTNGIANVGVNFLSIGDGDRVDAVRYTTPSFGGAAASVSHAVNGQVTAALRYSGQIGGVGVLGGVGWDSNFGNDTYAGSLGLNFGGIALNGAVGYQDNENAEEDFMYYVGLAHKGNYSDLGPTSLGVDFHVNNGGVGGGDNNKRVGVGLVQGVAAGADAFVGVGHNFGGDGAIESAQTVMAGMIIRF